MFFIQIEVKKQQKKENRRYANAILGPTPRPSLLISAGEELFASFFSRVEQRRLSLSFRRERQETSEFTADFRQRFSTTQALVTTWDTITCRAGNFLPKELAMKMLRFGAVLLLLCGMAFASTASFTQPRLAIFLSKTSYHHAWETSQLAGHGWVGIATLAGIPYDTFFVEEMPGDQELLKYSTSFLAKRRWWMTRRTHRSSSACGITLRATTA